MKKIIILLCLFFISFVVAEEIPLEDEECGLFNLAECIPLKIYEFFIGVINAPISPLLNMTKSLLTEPVQLDLFVSLWAIILYVISLFYGILMMYSGFNFMISGHNAAKRAKAKEWFVNIFVMIVLVQASYFLYSLILDIESVLTAGIINLINEDFFLITADNIINIGLQFFFAIFYVLVLITNVLFLSFRYIIVAFGIVFFPIGIFCYFIPPLNHYGRLIFNFLGVCIFTTFLSSLIFLVCSQLVEINVFENFKILVMISAFSISNLMMIYLMFFSAVKSAIKTSAGTITATAKYFS